MLFWLLLGSLLCPPPDSETESFGDDVRLLRRALEATHPGLYRYTSEEAMTLAFKALERDATRDLTVEQLYVRISALLALIRCDHTKAEVPEAIESMRTTRPGYLPFGFRWIAGRMYVDRLSEGIPLERGDEVLSIDGRPVADLVEAVLPLLSVDGFTDPTKRVEIESSTELMGGAIDHFWPFLYGWPESYEIEVRDAANGTIRTERLDPVDYLRWQEITTGGVERYSSSFGASVTLEPLGSQSACLRIGTFINYRNPVDPMDVFGELFAEVREIGADHLVIDLRDCGGGSDEVPAALLRHLIDEPLVSQKSPRQVRCYRLGDLAEHMSTWDPNAFRLPEEIFRAVGDGMFEIDAGADGSAEPLLPVEEPFAGDVTVLIGAANASGATNFLAVLRKGRPQVRYLGEPTGGSAEGPTAGLIAMLTLPDSGIRIRVPLIRAFNNAAVRNAGIGVRPDLGVRQTASDFLSSRDRVLEIAIETRGGRR